MSDKVVRIPGGVKLTEAMRIAQSQEQAQAMRANVSNRLSNVIAAAVTNMAIDQLHGSEVTMNHAVVLSQSSGVTEEDAVGMFRRVWGEQWEQRKVQLANQQKAMVAHALAVMAQNAPIQPQLVEELRKLPEEMVPEDLRSWLAKQPVLVQVPN